MKVNSVKEAWEKAFEIFPTDYEKDSNASEHAGYNIYVSTVPGVNSWISDLNDKLEINDNGQTINIWIEAETETETETKEEVESKEESAIDTMIANIGNELVIKARVINIFCTDWAQDKRRFTELRQQNKIDHEFYGMLHALKAMNIEFSLEYDSEVVNITAIIISGRKFEV